MREEFEKLPEIAARLSEYNIVFHENDYVAEGYSDNTKLWIAVGFVSGAYYAYQEQQKKISTKDELKELYRKEVDFLRNQTSKAILALYSENKEDALNILKESIEE